MRLHRLEITAWGPFPDEVTVDFDALGAEGLYLIQGATGAGKTSLLDAICYALYASVPGARASSRRLSSDHAEPGTTPVVCVELTASGRRLRVRRSPAFTRPKRSGTGEREVPATVSVDEWRAGRWQNISTRAREADDVIADVVGLGREQFATVIMLPQGDFAAFLRAAPDQRRELLKRLFDVTRFDDVERWLTDRRKALGDEVAALRADLAGHLHRVGDAVATAPGLECAVVPSAAIPDLLQVRNQIHELVTEVGEVAARSGAAVAVAEATRRAVDDRWASAVTLTERQGRWRAATEEAATLELGRASHEARAARLSLAERALECADVLRNEERARQGHADAAQTAGQHAVSVGLPVDVAEAKVQAILAGLLTSGEALDRLHRAQQTYQRSAATQQLHETAREGHQRELATLADRLEQARVTLARLTAARSDAGATAAQVDGVSNRLDDVTQTIDAMAHYERVVVAAERLRAHALDAVATENAAHSAFNLLRTRQLDAAAADLASRLEAGHECPVCGATTHPHPASAADRVDPRSVEQAEQDLEAARLGAAEARAALATCEGVIATVLQALGGSLPDHDELLRRRDELTRMLADAVAARESLDALDVSVAALDAQIEVDRTRLSEARDRFERADALAAAAGSDAVAQQSEIEAAIAAHRGCFCLSVELAGRAHAAAEGETLRLVHTDVQRAVQDLAESLAARARCAAALSSATSLCAERVAELGFDSQEQAQASALPASERLALTRELRDVEAQRVSVARALADPDLQGASAIPAPDLEALRAERDHTQRLTQRAAVEHSQVDGALRAVTERATAIDSLVRRLAPLAEEHLTVAGLADACAGLGSENTRRMPLSAYVLAGRLERVIDLANERLARMGDGRYRLEHTDEQAGRGARSGLGLQVIDSWTGRSRDPVSLSGGESFMASLALALGLADAVRAENGGVDLQTLFVDEGFGSLDEDSLDQVMDVLDGLREGGRAVGIVSHVPELRQRIPAQVVVSKSESGSTVSVRGVVPASGVA